MTAPFEGPQTRFVHMLSNYAQKWEMTTGLRDADLFISPFCGAPLAVSVMYFATEAGDTLPRLTEGDSAHTFESDENLITQFSSEYSGEGLRPGDIGDVIGTTALSVGLERTNPLWSKLGGAGRLHAPRILAAAIPRDRDNPDLSIVWARESPGGEQLAPEIPHPSTAKRHKRYEEALGACGIDEGVDMTYDDTVLDDEGNFDDLFIRTHRFVSPSYVTTMIVQVNRDLRPYDV